MSPQAKDNCMTSNLKPCYFFLTKEEAIPTAWQAFNHCDILTFNVKHINAHFPLTDGEKSCRCRVERERAKWEDLPVLCAGKPSCVAFTALTVPLMVSTSHVHCCVRSIDPIFPNPSSINRTSTDGLGCANGQVPFHKLYVMRWL